jgi:UDP-GlcNAc:undecaprenyl-phosphate GlcNAc-1-phosphate transferase
MNGFPPFLFLGVNWYLIALFFIPFSFACVLTPLFRFVAHKTGLLDKPNGILKKHQQATAYLGGLAVYIAIVLVYFLFNLFYSDAFFADLSGYYFLGITILLATGLIDDIFAISPFQKIVGQCLACIFFLRAGFFFKKPILSLFLPSFLCTPEKIFLIGVILSLWWMLSIINAINLIDVMDGLAVTVSFMALLGMLLYGGSFDKSFLVVPFLGVLMGFFFYNKPRASIYLGDAGSLVLGGILATTPFIFGWGVSCKWRMVIAPLIILLIPIAELCWLVLIRTHLRIPFYNGSPHHLALYLKRWGWPVEKILTVTVLVGAACDLIAKCVAFS